MSYDLDRELRQIAKTVEKHCQEEVFAFQLQYHPKYGWRCSIRVIRVTAADETAVAWAQDPSVAINGTIGRLKG